MQKIHVPPGAAPRSSRLISEYLDKIHAEQGVKSVRTDEDATTNAQAAMTWASENSVPVTNHGLPDTVVLTRDLTQNPFPQLSWSEDIWQKLQGEHPGWIITALEFLRSCTGYTKTVIWLNTATETPAH